MRKGERKNNSDKIASLVSIAGHSYAPRHLPLLGHRPRFMLHLYRRGDSVSKKKSNFSKSAHSVRQPHPLCLTLKIGLSCHKCCVTELKQKPVCTEDLPHLNWVTTGMSPHLLWVSAALFSILDNKYLAYQVSKACR